MERISLLHCVQSRVFSPIKPIENSMECKPLIKVYLVKKLKKKEFKFYLGGMMQKKNSIKKLKV